MNADGEEQKRGTLEKSWWGGRAGSEAGWERLRRMGSEAGGEMDVHTHCSAPRTCYRAWRWQGAVTARNELRSAKRWTEANTQ